MPTTGRKVKEFAKPIRQTLCLALKRKLASNRGLAKVVAEKLDCPIATIRSAAQEQKGGFDLIVSALMVAYGFEVNKVQEMVEDLQAKIEQVNSRRKSDIGWRELDSLLSETEKLSWLEVIKLCAGNSISVKRKRKKPS